MLKLIQGPFPKIKIVLADDHEIFLDKLTMMLNKIPEFEILGSANNGAELI